VNSSNKAEWNTPPTAASCPNCGGRELRVLSSIASHRLADESPEQPYAVMFVLECPCGMVFSWEGIERREVKRLD
jgi:hypothetical protein